MKEFKPIDWTKPLRMKNGRPVEVLFTDDIEPYPVLVSTRDALTGERLLHRYKTNGIAYISNSETTLENAPEIATISGWLNVYVGRNSDGNVTFSQNETRADADRVAAHDRFACVELNLTVEKGQGL